MSTVNREHEKGWLGKMASPLKKEKTKKAGIYVLGMISMLVMFGLEQIIRSQFFEGPDISAKLQGLVFTEGENDEWKVTLYMRVSNSGQSTAIEYGQLELSVSAVSQRPILFDFKKILNISSGTAIDDTLTTLFLKSFNTPTFKKGRIGLHSLKGKLLAEVVFDSSDVQFQWVISTISKPVFEWPNEPKEASYDSTRGLLKLAVKKYSINYHGKTYVNLVYPRSAKVEHKIVDDRIQLKYLIIGETLVVRGKGSWHPELILFIPHPAIADKLDYPEAIELTLVVERKTKHESFKLFPDKNSTQHIYIFKE